MYRFLREANRCILLYLDISTNNVYSLEGGTNGTVDSLQRLIIFKTFCFFWVLKALPRRVAHCYIPLRGVAFGRWKKSSENQRAPIKSPVSTSNTIQQDTARTKAEERRKRLYIKDCSRYDISGYALLQHDTARAFENSKR